MCKVLHSLALAALAAALPLVASADTNLDLVAGTTGSSGGDITFNGTSIAPVGSAQLANLTTSLSSVFSGLNETTLAALASEYSTTAISGSSLAMNEVFAVHTNGGNYAKVLLTAASSGSITLTYVTYSTSGTQIEQGSAVTLGGPAAPTITLVQNNYSWILPNAPNYGIAPGSIFVILGSGLANPGTAVLQSSAAPGIPTTLNGASITVTVGGTTVHPGMYYAVPTAIAAVLPSSTPVGTGTITVTYNSTPVEAPITVVPSALGFDTYYGTGSGLGAIEDASTYALFTATSSAHPGENIVFWGSGLGADTADSDTVFTSSPHSINTPLQIYIGGVKATILYQGASGYPGLNQIDVTIPTTVPAGCAVSVSAVTGTGASATVSNISTMPIAANGGTCTDPLAFVDPTTGSTLAGKTTVKFGGVSVDQSTDAGTVLDEAAAFFWSISGLSLTGYQSTQPSLGSCTVIQSNTTSPGNLPTLTGLNAGSISVQVPGGATIQLPSLTAGVYVAQLSSIPSSGGTYTFTGTGGADVSGFSTALTFLNPLLWTNASADGTVTRASGIPITWSGGAAGTFVQITGNSSSAGFSASFTCDAPVAALSFTVPEAVLLALPAGSGSLTVSNYSNPVSAGIPNLDFSYKMTYVGTTIDATYN